MNLSGFAGQSVLILVDGERLAGETMDDVDFTRIGMQNIDHIEIVKGAASASTDRTLRVELSILSRRKEYEISH